MYNDIDKLQEFINLSLEYCDKYFVNKIKTNPSLHNCQKGYASVNEKRMNMLIDFDGLTIIIGIVIYILICIFIHKKYKKEKIYYVFSTIMFFILCVLLS